MIRILLSLILFLIFVFLPVGYNLYSGKTAYTPNIEIPKDKIDCVENVFYMRKKHNLLLEKWRDASVRDGMKTYVSLNGKFKISLTGTCLGCHSNKATFCDRCHDYVGIKPKCWECHNIPETLVKNE